MQERFYFGDEVLPLFESGVPLLIEQLNNLPDRENVSTLGAQLICMVFVCMCPNPTSMAHCITQPGCFKRMQPCMNMAIIACNVWFVVDASIMLPPQNWHVGLDNVHCHQL